MAGQALTGDPVPTDGALPAAATAQLTSTPLSFYIHVPYCAARCGYCDFNTYTADQVRGAGPEVYLAAAHAELELAARVLGDQAPSVGTVFFGGGTPTLLRPEQLGGLLQHVKQLFGLRPDAEVTTEANPETLDAAYLDALLAAGINRLSMGMQSASPHVLRVLDRVHTPGRALEMAKLAHACGFTDVSLDLIYGTPGESLADWETSLSAALSVEPEHLSAYALIVEDGTALARRIRHGELPMPDDDDLADKYLLTEEALTAAGLENYEISNWAKPGHEARHNIAYWTGANWWGIGPGAHSHVGGVRWWNVRHPRSYADRLAVNQSPGQVREVLSDEDRRVERVLLELRLASGLPVDVLTPTERARLPQLRDRGLIVAGDPIRLTLPGRLLADGIVRELLD